MKKSKKKNKTFSFEEYKERTERQRANMKTWQLMKQNPNKTWEQIDGDYNRMSTLCNIAYILADVQDWCFMDVKDILRQYNMKARHEAKQNFSQLKKNISAVCYNLDQCAHRVNDVHECQNFVAGFSDLVYQTLCMLMDRMAHKKDVIHFIHLLRTIENHNQIFPELDKGRYIFNNYEIRTNPTK